MGLDMYLSAKRYLSSWQDEEKAISEEIANINGLGCGGFRPKYVVTEAMYWRKANAIHKWFVDHCQDGNDDCGEYYVSPEQLVELATTLNTIIANPQLAGELLPPMEGFFFGSTEMDEWYWDDVKHTAKAMEKLLGMDHNQWSLYYSSSW